MTRDHVGYDDRVNRIREATVSLRWLFPFMRASGQAAEDLELLAREGLGLRDLADPDARIRHHAVCELVGAAVVRLGRPSIGLEAGERVAPGDFDALELALRSCSTLRDAIELGGRYMTVVHGAQEAHLLTHGELAVWELRITDDVPQLPASNDFALASALTLCRRYMLRPPRVREVHLRHRAATSSEGYARVFGPDAVFHFGRRHNALVFEQRCLDTPMALAHGGLRLIYEAQVKERLERMHATRAMSLRVRQVLEQQLRSGEPGIVAVARRLGMNVGALRRGLAEEGTTYRKLRDDLRMELAERYLADRALSVSEVAFLLGFATVAAFSKAFRRSHAVPPSAYRTSLRGGSSTPLEARTRP